MNNFKENLSFDDVLLEPRYSDIKTRTEINTDSALAEDLIFSLPIISSPMDTITESKMAYTMHENGGVGIIHRYNTIKEQVEIVHRAVDVGARVGAAIGTSGDYVDRAIAMQDSGASFLCLDVAHGHHSLVREALTKLRDIFGNEYHLMAGNVATFEAFMDLAAWGAHSIRVGIGGGSICSTRIQTGHGVPTLSSVMAAKAACESRLREGLPEVKVVADGGIRNSGDIVKALAMGADFVMVGSLLAATNETPGETINTPNGKFKTYRGMASKDAQMDWRGRTSSLEGITATVPCKGSVVDVLEELKRGIRSGLSYSGARDLKTLQSRASFIRQTSASQHESTTHINRR